MSMGIGKSNKIRHIVRIRQMLVQWRRKAAAAASSPHRTTGVPADVPEGHVAICVGSSCTRFVVRATYLNHPILKTLLAQAAEEYGFAHQGPLAIPTCEESLFQDILRFISRARSSSNSVNKVDEFQRCCLVGYHNGLDVFGDSRPLLREYTGKPVC